MNDDEMIIKSGESELKTKTATGIGRFLTQKLIRTKKFEKLIQHPVHGASHTTLKNSATSNAMLTDIYTRRSDAFFRFAVVGEQTVYQHLPTYGDGSMIEKMKTARDVTREGSRRWRTS
jgi:hypothetical protein